MLPASRFDRLRATRRRRRGCTRASLTCEKPAYAKTLGARSTPCKVTAGAATATIRWGIDGRSTG
eukprot:164968-Pyramimonas_sp.AAC.1